MQSVPEDGTSVGVDPSPLVQTPVSLRQRKRDARYGDLAAPCRNICEHMMCRCFLSAGR
jgi:hypothetical protein